MSCSLSGGDHQSGKETMRRSSKRSDPHARLSSKKNDSSSCSTPSTVTNSDSSREERTRKLMRSKSSSISVRQLDQSGEERSRKLFRSKSSSMSVRKLDGALSRDGSDERRTRQLTRSKSSSISVRQLEDALRRLQESGIATDSNGMLDLQQLQVCLQKAQEPQTVVSNDCEKTNEKVTSSGQRGISSQKESEKTHKTDGRIGKSPHRKMFRKSYSSSRVTDSTSLIKTNEYTSPRSKEANVTRGSSLNEDHFTLEKSWEFESEIGCAHHRLRSSTSERRISSLLVDALKRDYVEGAITPTTGVARFVDVRDEEIFSPDTSILFMWYYSMRCLEGWLKVGMTEIRDP